MPFGIQPIHIVLIIVIGFLLFGANKLPEMGRSLGKTISEFRKGTKEATEGFKEEINKPAQNTTATAAPTQPPAPAPTGSTVAAGNFCIKCGAANPPEALFCASCGTKLVGKAS
jgi:TatA/E family protein of Tat protein translocase